MIGLDLARSGRRPLRVLCLGAHCDDIEIGCGGSMLRLIETEGEVDLRWHVFVSDPIRAAETRSSAARFGIAVSEDTLRIESFRDGYLPYEGAAVKEAVHRSFEGFVPDVVFTHTRNDRHQDHRMISDLTWNAFRDQMVLEYEIPKWDGDLGQPNFFVPLSRKVVDTKLAILDEEYGQGSQRSRGSFRIDVFEGSMAMRGLECNAPEGFAEAFHARKLVFDEHGSGTSSDER